MKAFYYEQPKWGPSPANEDWIRLAKDWCFVVDGTEFWVPQDYDSDGASIPGLFWLLPGIGTPTEGYNAVGAWAHDPLYLTQALPFNVCNEVARQLWIQAGKHKFDAKLMYWAVQSPIARLSYRQSDKDKQELARIRNSLKHRPDKSNFDSLWFK